MCGKRIEIGPHLPYTYPQCVPGNNRHATRSMKEPSEATPRPVSSPLQLPSTAQKESHLAPQPALHTPARRSVRTTQQPAQTGERRPTSDSLAPEPRPRITHPPPPFRLGQLRASEALPLRRNHGQGQWPATTWWTPCPVRRPTRISRKVCHCLAQAVLGHPVALNTA
jgi:hypothetical protein